MLQEKSCILLPCQILNSGSIFTIKEKNIIFTMTIGRPFHLFITLEDKKPSSTWSLKSNSKYQAIIARMGTIHILVCNSTNVYSIKNSPIPYKRARDTYDKSIYFNRLFAKRVSKAGWSWTIQLYASLDPKYARSVHI